MKEKLLKTVCKFKANYNLIFFLVLNTWKTATSVLLYDLKMKC